MAVLYVDESGEEGFTQKASEWFVLGAVLQQSFHARSIREMYADFKAKHRKEDSWFFHFQKKEHDERIAFCRHLSAQTDYRARAVLIHKPSIANTANFQRKYYLYFYALRFLLERASQWCDTHAGDHLTIKMSSRRGLDVGEVEKYLARVRNSPFVRSDKMVWDYLQPPNIEILPNKELIGLQAADCVASAIGKAVELSDYGTLEPRYIKELAPLFERDRGSVRANTKVWPALNKQEYAPHGRCGCWLTD